jgi:hypothetical protein
MSTIQGPDDLTLRIFHLLTTQTYLTQRAHVDDQHLSTVTMEFRMKGWLLRDHLRGPITASLRCLTRTRTSRTAELGWR